MNQDRGRGTTSQFVRLVSSETPRGFQSVIKHFCNICGHVIRQNICGFEYVSHLKTIYMTEM